MSVFRVTLAALAAAFTLGMTSMASADCCGWGYSAPVTYAPAYSGCGGCGAPVAVAPVAYNGCGGCGAAAVYAAPVAVAPIAISPVYPTAFGGPCCGFNGCGNCGPTDWSGGCGGCGGAVSLNVGCNSCGGGWSGGCGNCGGGCGGCGYSQSSLYVVNQGPVYSGPAATIPYATYSPTEAYAPASDYPYVPGYGYGRPAYPGNYAAPYYRHRYAYNAPAYMHPRYYGARPYGARYYGPRAYGPSYAAPRYYGHYRQYP